MGTWRRGGGGIRRSHFVAMAHLKAELWLVRWYQNKHGGPNESNKAFENKCYLLYEINIFRVNNSRVRKVIHGWLSAWPAGSHRLVSWFPGSAKASPGNQETRRRDQLVPQTINHGFPYYRYITIIWWERTQFSNSTFWRLVFSHSWFRMHPTRVRTPIMFRCITYNTQECSTRMVISPAMFSRMVSLGIYNWNGSPQKGGREGGRERERGGPCLIRPPIWETTWPIRPLWSDSNDYFLITNLIRPPVIIRSLSYGTKGGL